WMTNENDSDHEFPFIENMVEGNAPVMHGGVLTDRNYDETYNTMVYSRTAYGTNAAGNRLYMIVIDKSTSPKYGTSAGCTTAQMCQILQSMCPDVWDVVNFDAGGSAEMLVDGVIINTTTEGTPRPVATGWMLEAVGEEDNEVASIAFDDFNVRIPVYSSYKPRILGYNRRGELVNKDVAGFTLTCDATLGSAQGDTFTAGAEATTGVLTAALNGMETSMRVTLLPAQPAIKVKPAIVIDRRAYPVEVTATIDGTEYGYNPAGLQWSIDHPEVATIAGGVLRGVSNGEAHLTCLIGDLQDETDVLVQISDVPYRYEPWTEWTVKASGHKNAVLASDGTMTYTYGTGRAAYIELDKQITLYGLPDEVGLSFTSDVPITRVTVDVRNRNFTKTHNQYFAPDSAFAAGEEHRIYLDLDEMGGADAVSTYPLTLHSIRFEPQKGQEATERTIVLGPLYAHYAVAEMPTGDVTGDGRVDVEDVNAVINIILKTKTASDYPGQADVTGDSRIDVEDVNAIINIILKV
ncbi:MAG: phosphodiester glycosidase family protein, partial [Muribaculaceae bacterium]|nr:phosphodiester glycosidase family protein [Muribaculaceae bacterium]